MKKVWKSLIALILVIVGMTCTAFAEVNLKVNVNGSEVMLNGTSDHLSQNIMVETWNKDTKYSIHAGKTDNAGNFKFKFKTKANLDYDGAINVGGELKEFKFSTLGSVEVQQVKLNKTSIKLKKGQAETLEASIIPKDASNKEIVWTSKNLKIASVDNNGKVTAKSVGKTIIEAVSVFGKKKASCTVTVIKSGSETEPEDPKDKEDKEVSVYIRVEGYDHTVIPRTKVTTGIFDLNPYVRPITSHTSTKSKGWGIGKFKKPVNAHAIVKILERKHIRYDFQDYGWSLYIAMIDGDREFDQGKMSGWMYSVNGKLPPIGCNGKPLKDGDEILWFYGAYGFDTIVTELNSNKKSVKLGEKIEITLNGFSTTGASGSDKVDEYNRNFKKIEDATILVDGKEYKVDGKVVKTDSDGKATLKFNKPGKYKLSAIRYKTSGDKKIDIVRPLPVVIDVKGDAIDNDKNVQKQSKENKKEVESKLVKDIKNEINKNSIASNKLQKEIKNNKEEYTVSYSVLIDAANKVSKIVDEAISKSKDSDEKEKIEKEIATVPINIDDTKDNAVLKIEGNTVKSLKNKNVGVKVLFNNSGITIPYDILPEIKLNEYIEIKKDVVKDSIKNKLCSDISKDNSVLSKMYNLSMVKVDRNNKEEKIDIDKDYLYVVIKMDTNKLKNISKRSLKINWYDTKNKKWIILDSQYIKDKNVVIGRFK